MQNYNIHPLSHPIIEISPIKILSPSEYAVINGPSGFHFQLTEEKLGTSEKTELDSHFEMLAERADSAKKWTEKILGDTESVLIPNPGNRAEDFIFEKIEKKKPTRLSNLEYMGLDMIEVLSDCGGDLGLEAKIFVI